jgi:hypothetical protein
MKYNGTTYELTEDELRILQGCICEIRDTMKRQNKASLPTTNREERLNASNQTFACLYGEDTPFDLIKEILIDIPY